APLDRLVSESPAIEPCASMTARNPVRAKEPRAVWINSLFVASRRVVRLLVFGGRQSTFRVCLSLNLGNPAAPSALKAKLAAADAPPPLLHPEMAEPGPTESNDAR